MTSFFQQILDVISLAFDFILNILEAIVNLFSLIFYWMSWLTTLFGFLPSILVSFATLAMFLSLMFFIIGRNK